MEQISWEIILIDGVQVLRKTTVEDFDPLLLYASLVNNKTAYESGIASEQGRLDAVEAEIQQLIDAGFTPPS